MKNPFKEWLETDNGKKSNNYSTLSGPQYLENRLYHAYSAGMLTEYEKTKQLQQTIEWYEVQLRELRAKVVSLEEKLQQLPQESKP